MNYKIFYNQDDEIISVTSSKHTPSWLPVGTVRVEESDEDPTENIKPKQTKFVPRAEPVSSGYQSERRLEYGSIRDQLGDLFDDIEAGRFGAGAKKGKWYQRIKAAKEKYPKP